MESKSVEEVLKERCNEDYKTSASYLCKTLLSRNEELEKCVRELLEVVSGKIAHPNKVSEILSNAKKLLNNE